MSDQIEKRKPDPIVGGMSLDQGVQLFRNLFAKGMGDIVESFGIYARMLDAYPDTARATFAEACPGTSPEQWQLWEAIGRGNTDARLLDGAYAPCAYHLRLLPIATQRAALDDGVEVLTLDQGLLRVAIRDLSPDQARQVFHGRTIRDQAAQRAWLESQRAKRYIKTPRETPPAFEFRGDALIVHQPGKFNFRDLISQWTAAGAR